MYRIRITDPLGVYSNVMEFTTPLGGTGIDLLREQGWTFDVLASDICYLCGNRASHEYMANGEAYSYSVCWNHVNPHASGNYVAI